MTDNKTIGIKVRFFTTGLQVGDAGNNRKSCWDTGCVIMEQNDNTGVPTTSDSEIFRAFEDIVPAIKELFRRQKIAVVSNCSRPRLVGKRARRN